MKSFLQPLHQFLGFISQTKLFGWLPLDIVTHFLLGLIFTIFLLSKKVSHLKVFIIILSLAVFKEIFDSFSLIASAREAIKDILVTIAYPSLSWLVAKVKIRTDKL